MTNPTPHGQVPEALIDLIDEYAETRHRYGRIYNARTEAARKAVIEALSGVQALSAAPAVPAAWKAVPVNPTPEMWKAAKSVPHQNPYGLVWDAMLAASPTPPAEQQAQPGVIYAVLPAPTASIGTDDAWHEAAMRDFADRTHAARLRCKSEQARLATLWGYVRADATPKQAAPKAAPGEPTDSDGFGSAEHWKEKAQYWAGVAHRLRGEALRGEPVDGIVQPPAPQQEVQEPALFVSSKQLAALTDPDDPEGEHGRYLPARKTSQGLFTQPLYTTPQPAPAPLSDDTKRLDWLDRNIFSREMSEWDAKYGHGPDYNMWVVFSPKGVQGSARNIIDAALAAQGGKT